MDRLALEESESRFASFIGSLNEVIGHRDRIGPFRDYCAGLLAGCERKSVESLAAITAPSRVVAQHQSLLHFVGNAPWSDAAVLSRVRDLTLPVLEKHGPVEAFIVDDTGFPKKGKHSVGVARQYCGQLGKQDNCQIAVSLSVANHHASLPIAYSLCLPQEWTNDPVRRAKAAVPDNVAFQTKPEIALAQIAQALEDGVPQGTVLMDAGYGVNMAFRDGVTALGLSHVAGILSQTSVWAPEAGPLPPKPWTGQGRPPKLMRRDQEHRPVPVRELALSLPQSAFETIAWREGACETLSSRFARVRVCPAHRNYHLTAPRPEEWLLIEWPLGEDEPTKCWLSTLPQTIGFASLVDTAKLRWRIERGKRTFIVSDKALTHSISNRRSASGITKAAAGAAFTTTPRSAPPSSSWNARRVPPQDLVASGQSKKLVFPKVTSQGDMPLRPERHLPNSIATLKRRIAAALARALPRCPCCGSTKQGPNYRSSL
jgi:SRSO17 transposase